MAILPATLFEIVMAIVIAILVAIPTQILFVIRSPAMREKELNRSDGVPFLTTLTSYRDV